MPRVGEISEICIGGKQVLRGYLHPPKQEVRRSLESCFALADPLFANGDLGVYRPDMAIGVPGGEDTQVKLSGERIELEEVESIILSLGSVVKCTVLVEQNQLHAIVQVNKNGQASVQVSERYLARLPKQILPRVHMSSDLPLLTSGKIDKQATLRIFRGSQREDQIQQENMPRTDGEHAIVSIVGQLAQRYGFFLELSGLLLAGSIRSLATLIDKWVDDAAGPANRDGYVQAIGPHRALWMGQERYSDSTYNVGRVLCLHEIELNPVVASIRLVIQIIDAFKIIFEWDFDEKRLRQRMDANLRASIRVYELQGRDDVEIVDKEICEQNFKNIFDLDSAPLAPFRVFATVLKEYYFFYIIHYILVDERFYEMLLGAVPSEYLCRPWRDAVDSSWIASDTEYHNGESLR